MVCLKEENLGQPLIYKNCRFLLLLLFFFSFFFFFFFAILKIHNWITYQQLFFIIWKGCRLLSWEILVLVSVYDKQRTVGLKGFPYKWKIHPCTGSWFYCSFFFPWEKPCLQFQASIVIFSKKDKDIIFFPFTKMSTHCAWPIAQNLIVWRKGNFGCINE